MKMFKLLSVPLAFLLFMAACTKEGPAGPAGTNGNANVIVVNHPTDTVGSSEIIEIYLPASVTPSMIDSGLILVYYFGAVNDACEFWYPSPGLGCGGLYQTRWIYDKLTNAVTLTIRNPDGSAYTGPNRIFAKTKVVIATGTTFLTGKKDIDFSNYEEVKRYLNLKD